MRSPTTAPLVEKMKVRSRLIRLRCSAATARQELPIGLLVSAFAVAVVVRTVLPRPALSGAGGLAVAARRLGAPWPRAGSTRPARPTRLTRRLASPLLFAARRTARFVAPGPRLLS